MSSCCIEKNKVVSVTYRIIDESGNVAEQSDIPIEYIHGVPNAMFERVERALSGKTIGETVEVKLKSEEAFGPHKPELAFSDAIENVPPQYRFVGARPTFENENGEMREMVVTKIEGGKLTVDANHPFAGQDITFIVTVEAVRDATNEELANKLPASAGVNLLQ